MFNKRRPHIHDFTPEQIKRSSEIKMKLVDSFPLELRNKLYYCDLGAAYTELIAYRRLLDKGFSLEDVILKYDNDTKTKRKFLIEKGICLPDGLPDGLPEESPKEYKK